MAATGPSDVWMFTATDRFPDHYEVRHWDGRSWTTSTLRPTCECRPLAGSGIAAVAPDDVWAVVHRPATGSQYWHSERGTWRGYPPAGQDGRHPLQISAIAGSGPNDVWAAGMDPATTTGVLQHWDGTSWRSVADPDLADHLVVGLAVPAPGDVWLVVVGSHGTELPEYQHHTSAGWQRLPGPLRAAEQLDQLVVTGDQNAYASVEHTGGGQPALGHWNGRDWQPVTLPAGTFTGQVAADGAGGVWLATNGKTTVDETGPRTTPTALLHLAQGTVTALPGPRPALTGQPPRYDTTVLGPPWPDEITTTLLGAVPHTTTV
jgi:hypothetical protein